MSTFMIPLTDCRNGDAGLVVDIAGTCATTRRLAEMGVHAGSHLRVMRAGTPMIVESGNTRLCLRAEMAASVVISLGTESTHPIPEVTHASEVSPAN